ncbi:DUF6232 family protein [Cohnella luojiensis]|uniref:Uncharacterized protein n=1 Tax=Cohnella luojiensis TaxID=652876 RepID=A0A4Y8M131_9BACL|nr:DUF6232 family protein [Cohnella luojiensis]TFE28553.1 hypothetical protein E2980_06895 [Cohnella luojiensis]
MENQPIYKDNNFTITKELFISGNTRFAMQHLCSVKLVKSKRQIPYTLLVLEILLIVTGFTWDFRFHSILSLIGILGLIASIALYIFIKPVHKLWLVFTSGEREMIGVTDYAYLEGLANAFSRCIVETKQRSLMIS